MKNKPICPYPAVKAAIEFISSDEAKEILLTNPSHQRRIGRSNITKIANDMENGRFHLNGEPVIIGRDGNLLDGQHRLQACVNSKHGFWSVVVRGVDEDLFHIINIGKSRSLADILQIAGEINVNVLAASLYRLAEYTKSSQSIAAAGTAISVSEAMDTLQMMPTIRASVAFCQKGNAVVSSSRIAWLHCIATENRPDIAPEFFNQLYSGEMLKASSPIYLLRSRLIADRQSKSRLPLREIMALVVKAWNAHSAKQLPKVLRWGCDEQFPELLLKSA